MFPYLAVGDVAHVYMSPEYGFGAVGDGLRIGPNAWLWYEVELLAFGDPMPKPPPPQTAAEREEARLAEARRWSEGSPSAGSFGPHTHCCNVLSIAIAGLTMSSRVAMLVHSGETVKRYETQGQRERGSARRRLHPSQGEVQQCVCSRLDSM